MERLKEYAMQYQDGLITNEEFMNKVILHLMSKNTELADTLSEVFLAIEE